MRQLKRSTARDIAVLMVDSTDHITGKTGLTLAVTVSKAAGAFSGTGAPVATEIANGWYKLALTTGNTDTLGDLAIRCTATGADPADILCQVVAYDMADAVRLGLTAIPNANAEAAGGLFTRGSGPGQIAQDADGRINTNMKALGGSENAAGKARDGWLGLATIGTAQAGGPNTITLEAGASDEPNFYKDQACAIVEGTGAGQVARITASDGDTKVATVSAPWVVEPDNTSKYWLIGRIE